MKGVAGEDDKFSDLVIAANFANSSSVLKLDNPKMRAINSLLMVGTISTAIVTLITPVFISYPC